MKRVELERCSVITLVLKRKWYEMIESGEKLQEYRTSKNVMKQIERWLGRAIIHDKHLVVRFCLGYGKNRKSMWYLADRVFLARESVFKNWGEPEGPHYGIKLGDRIEVL